MVNQNSQSLKFYLYYTQSLPLKHKGDCHFIGISEQGTIYVDEIYGEADWLAQYAFRFDGTLVASSDEFSGESDGLFPIPTNLAKPLKVEHLGHLNFGGARLRGMRDEDRIQDMVQPLSISEKMALSNRLNIPPMRLLGIAESRVLAQAQMNEGTQYVLCRRLKIAYTLPERKLDVDKLPYDYDTLILHIAYLYDAAADEFDLAETLNPFPGVNLNRPMDCMVWQNWLLIVDGGGETLPSAVHLWQVKPIVHPDRKNDQP